MQWVSVKEKLPETGVEVLVEVNGHRGPSWRNNHNLVAYLTKGGCWVEERHGWNPLPVTHWMPLPKPPTASNNSFNLTSQVKHMLARQPAAFNKSKADKLREGKGEYVKKLVLIVAVFAILLISCTPKIKEGEVYDKEHRPAHTAVIMMPLVQRVGKVTTTKMIPMVFFYPEAWYVSYRAFNEKSKKWDSATVWVPRDVYDLVQIGGWYERTENDLDEQPRVRQKDKE